MNIVLCSNDRLLLENWNKIIKEKYIIIQELQNLENSLIIIDYSDCDLECINNIKTLVNKNKILVLHRAPNINTAKELLNYGVKGYGNALMRDHFLLSAIKTIKEGMVWLYPAFTSLLIDRISSNNKTTTHSAVESLTKREKEVSLLLKDALTYKEIAQKLGITSRTVKAHAHNSYKKLAVKDRLGLALLLK